MAMKLLKHILSVLSSQEGNTVNPVICLPIQQTQWRSSWDSDYSQGKRGLCLEVLPSILTGINSHIGASG
jgi:hypothetical protein